MSTLSKLSPPNLWRFFDKICSIPHPSYHEEALASTLVSWAKEKGFWCERDEGGNLLIRKPATKGMENLTPVVLQAHLDMVPQKNSDTLHDFVQDPIQPYIEGEWVKARGTTLGADNGIGMASALAVLDDDNLQHGPLEVLLTMSEEVGMEGAFALNPGWLNAKILINTDSETEGEVYIGCAGGVDVLTTLPLEREALPEDHDLITLSLKGLKGGHSGAEIHLGRGNANKLLARFLFMHAREKGWRLLDFHGGTLRNAIPREAFSTLAVPVAQRESFKETVSHYLNTLKSELRATEEKLLFHVQPASCHDTQVLTDGSRDRVIAFLNAMPHGVIRYSDEMEGVVETSLNLGVVCMTTGEMQISSLVRSLTDSARDYLVEMLMSLGALADAKTVAKGSYPGWQPDSTSRVMHLVCDTYQKLFKKTPNILVIHAGLECGLFKKPYPNMDMVSIGPTIKNPHSPDESVHIESVSLYWQLLTELLKAIPKNN